MSKNKNLHDIVYCEDGTMSIGNYENIQETGDKDNSGHKLYSASCKTCGVIIVKKLADIRRMSLKCTHAVQRGETRRTYIYGIGLNDMPRGWITENNLNERIYSTWKHMLLRTTPKFWEECPTYTGTTVCDEWRYLSVFVEDIKTLDGYSFWINNPNCGVMLDKDTKVLGNKHYSKNTCCFLSHTDSNRDVNRRHPENQLNASRTYGKKYGKSIKAIDILTGECKVFPSQKAASRELQVLASTIWMILSEDEKYSSYKTTKSPDGRQWTFTRYIDDAHN